MRAQLAIADVEWLVVDEHADQLAVGYVDDFLRGVGEAVGGLGVGQRPGLVDPVEIASRQAVRLALVQVAPPAHVTVGQREHRLCLGQQIQVQVGLPKRPRLDRERVLQYHGRSSSSARSVTTISAPCCFSASACPTRSTPTTNPKPPARPAATPASASSKTTAALSLSPRARAPARKVSGAGFPRRCSCSATTPSIRASNRASMPAATSTSRQLALEDTTARGSPAARTAWT